MAGSQFDMKAKPGKGMHGRPVGGGVVIVVRILRVGNVGDGGRGVAKSPRGVIEIGSLRGRIGGNADAPAFIEDHGGAEICGVKNGVRGRFLRRRGHWGMMVRGEQTGRE
jgi:hypothetical protein